VNHRSKVEEVNPGSKVEEVNRHSVLPGGARASPGAALFTVGGFVLYE